jgi:H+/Cl- antiporter ClcA
MTVAAGGGAGPAPDGTGAAVAAVAADPMALLRSRSYVQLLVLAGLIGIPVSVVAYWFLKLVSWLQENFFQTIPKAIGFAGTPAWWPLPLLAISGLLVGATITYLPGTAGHEPSEGFKAGGAPQIIEIPGVFLAALATLSLGVVLGPEAPLIAIGGGLGVLAVRLAKRDAPPTVAIVIATAGSFAAISALLGSPIVGAFLLMEASGLGGPMLGLVLIPGLLAAGIGSLVFVGLDQLTGFGTFSLAIPGLPAFHHPTGVMFLWSIAFGLVAAVLATVVRLIGVGLRPMVEKNRLLVTPMAGLAVAGLAIGFSEATGKGISEVLFSGQNELPGLVQHAAAWTVGALLLLIAFKSLAYGISLSGFRGGPVFPSMFIGGAIGVAASHLPGMALVPAVAMGIGAMATSMLKLPFTSVLLASLLVLSDALATMPLVIVAVVVAFVATAWLPQTPAELFGKGHGTPADGTSEAVPPSPAPTVGAGG